MKKSKPFWKSKTLWVNGLIVVSTYLGVLPVTKSTVLAAATVNFALRTLTNKQVTLKDAGGF